jgi:hypothetical protein
MTEMFYLVLWIRRVGIKNYPKYLVPLLSVPSIRVFRVQIAAKGLHEVISFTFSGNFWAIYSTNLLAFWHIFFEYMYLESNLLFEKKQCLEN